VDWGAGLLVVVLTMLLVLGTKLSSRVSLVITTIKVAIVLFVVLLGAFYVKSANYQPFVPPPSTGSGGGGGLEQSLFSLLAGGSNSTFGLFGLLAGASAVGARRGSVCHWFFAFIGFARLGQLA
jgi:APA family basic amino acid/polyamine antiporter